MDERKYRILQAIIDDYILTAEPVGSRTISRKYDMGLSSATIRNEMSDLEELGYLDQPHVSAGRIPSAKAYRLYVDQLLESGQLKSDDEASVRAYFAGRARQMEDVIDHAAQVISNMTNYLAVVLPPSGRQPLIRTVQLVPVGPGSALVLVVTDSGIIRDTVIPCPGQLDHDSLYAISRQLTEELEGHSIEEAAAIISGMTGRLHESARFLASLSDYFDAHTDAKPRRHVAVGGTSKMLTYPEYSDMEKVRGLLSLVETRDRLAAIVAQHGDVAFTVRIGPESGIPEMSDCSIVTATYSTRAGEQGTIGVIGPTRMRYSRVLSVLGTMGQQLSELFGAAGEFPEEESER
ncbi:MAG: heat-inducible transcription repressor HrcA [Clostridia bacterium]|nr:heat-inducible transcription repressor HrcA [Clostridia bacterium]MBR1684550.1 heat-inducible transcription repressor HrcA [Clostridia bacterium]MBR2287147.1 heat-inducible transcription repressor HrcA [Clostridia bacterium]